MTTPLNDQRDSLRESTRHADTKASLLLLAPGAVLAGASIVNGLHGAAAVLASWALITAVAMAIPIGAAIWPRSPRPGVEELEQLHAIVATKWRWLKAAIILGGLALAFAAAAVIAATY